METEDGDVAGFGTGRYDGEHVANKAKRGVPDHVFESNLMQCTDGCMSDIPTTPRCQWPGRRQ